jgi:hypothetical protein
MGLGLETMIRNGSIYHTEARLDMQNRKGVLNRTHVLFTKIVIDFSNDPGDHITPEVKFEANSRTTLADVDASRIVDVVGHENLKELHCNRINIK